MKVTTRDNKTPFSALPNGRTFTVTSNPMYFIKTEEVGLVNSTKMMDGVTSDKVNAVCLHTGEYLYINPDSIVIDCEHTELIVG